MSGPAWVFAAALDDLDPEDVTEVEVAGQTIAIYGMKDGYFATNGICSHEYARLAEGLIVGNQIECPKHQGRFDIRTGEAKGAPASLPICTYPVRTVGAVLEIQLP